MASQNSAALMIRRRNCHKATARSVPPEHRTSSRSVLIAPCEAHLVLTPGEIFAEICWFLSHCDATQVAAVTKALKAAQVDAGRQLRYRRRRVANRHVLAEGYMDKTLVSIPFPNTALAMYLLIGFP